MRRLQIAALILGVIAVAFVLLCPDLSEPIVIVKGHRNHSTSWAHFAVASLGTVASQQPRLQFIANISHQNFSSLSNQNLIELTCARLC